MPDWDWKLRLFTSVDLVGSTQYKQSRSDHPQHWAPIFKEFFSEFPAAVTAAYEKLSPKFKPCPEKLTPWKFSGDEILFHTTLASCAHTVSHIAAFKNAVEFFPVAWAEKNVPLKLKATAWVAGFPVNNTELEIRADGNPILDFIGPGIDLGFRIARFSDARRFVLSAELALMILDAVHVVECDEKLFRLHFHAKEPLKGVINNLPYPIVWLDMQDDHDNLEDQLLGTNRVAQPDILKRYLRSFLDSTPQLIRPFIDGDPDEKYSRIPEQFVELRDQMRAEESERGYLESTVDEPQDGNATEFKEPQIPHSRKKVVRKPRKRT